jgi:hypothetical protein
VVDGEHLDAITATMDQLPDTTPPQVRALVETTLVDTARVSDPMVVRRQGRILLDRIDADGTAPNDQVPAVRNELHLQPTSDGGVRFRGRLTKQPAEALWTLLATHTTPQSPIPGVPDPRSPAERAGDGLDAILHLAIGSGSNPTRGGAKPHINLTVDLNHFLAGSGVATADSGSVFCPDAVLQTACDADVVRIVLTTQGAPVNVGYTHRVVTVRQRAALVARDKGCAFPGCHLPPQWTDAHHIIHWKDGGRTDLPNLVLLCRRHHTLLHNSDWVIRMIDGIPWFTPPRWVDPQQRLIRNILRQ